MKKAVVFDLDETLSHFSNLSGFIKAVEVTSRRPFHTLEALKAFPEVFRPGIGEILRDLVWRKQRGEDIVVVLYTNNNGGSRWPSNIINGINELLNFPLFTELIPGYTGKGCRLTPAKTLDDLYKCSKIRKGTPILFVDDCSHPEMQGDDVYYIQVPAYVPSLNPQEMIGRFIRRFRVKGNPNREKMNSSNPKYVLRNWMAQLAIDAAEKEDFTVALELYRMLKEPYSEQPEYEEKWFKKRPEWARHRVGCSMLSCSS